MVEDDILVVTPPDTVLLRFGGILGRIAQTETDIADNHVVGIDPHGVVAQADAVARGGLAGDGQVSVLNAQIAQQFDRSRHVEDDDAFARSLDGLARRPGARIIEIGDMPDLAAAAARLAKTMKSRDTAMRALNQRLRDGLAAFPEVVLNSPADAVPEVLNFSTNCVNSQTFIEYLSGRHIYISGGSACDKGEPSHTLMAMGAPDLAVRTALRVSFCGDNTPEDVQALLDGLKDGLKELQPI